MTIKDRAKPLNTLYPPSKKKTVQNETNALKRGKGVIVEITTISPGKAPKIRFGYKMASGNIYGIKLHRNKRQWRLYPVEGPDFVVLNEEEYIALKDLFAGQKTADDFWSINKELIDKNKVWRLFEGTKEKHK